MDVGILTMNRIINYGSFLQAYALQQMLRQLGLEPEFLDIGPTCHTYDKMYRENPQYQINILKAKTHKLLGHHETCRIMLQEQHHWKFYHTLYNSFPLWWEKWLGMKRVDNLRTDYDRIVIGSDEVFNCTQGASWSNDMKWFGDGLNTRKLISYAASFGFTTKQRLVDAGLEQSVHACLSNFAALSVRDENSYGILTGLGFEPEMHLDPVLAYDYEKMVSVQPDLQNVLIVYTYPDRLQEQNIIDQIQELAQREKLRVVSIGSYYPWCENKVLTPFEVLQYFFNAKYIVTDTFHGSVFSLKFQRAFAVLVRESNRQKLSDLLNRFNQEEAIVTNGSDLARVLHREMPRAAIKEKIRTEQRRTMDYLERNLCGEI